MHWLYSLHSTSFPQTRGCIDWERHFSGSCPLQNEIRKRESYTASVFPPLTAFIKKWQESFATMFRDVFDSNTGIQSVITFLIFFFPPLPHRSNPAPSQPPPPPSCSTTWKGFWRCIPWKLAPFPLSSFITPWTGRTVSTSSSSSRLAQESSTKLFQSNYYQKHKAVSAAKRNYRRLIPIPLQSFATSLLSEPERGSLTSWRLLNWISCGFCSFVFNRILATELTEHLS